MRPGALPAVGGSNCFHGAPSYQKASRIAPFGWSRTAPCWLLSARPRQCRRPCLPCPDAAPAVTQAARNATRQRTVQSRPVD